MADADTGTAQRSSGAIETAVKRYAKGDDFAIPKSAYVVAVSKS